MIIWLQKDSQYDIFHMITKIPDWVYETKSEELVEIEDADYLRLKEKLDKATEMFYEVQGELLDIMEKSLEEVDDE